MPIKKTHEKFITEIINLPLICLDEYVDSNYKLLFKCSHCNCEWTARPRNILSGKGCPNCARIRVALKHRISEKAFKSKLPTHVELLGKYTKMEDSHQFKCNICDSQWKVRASNVAIRKTGCPHCNMKRGEQLIKNELEDLRLEYIPQHTFKDCQNVKELPFDFYIPSLNLIIEVDGEQHRNPIEFFGGISRFKIRQKLDRIKNEYCISNNINIIRLEYNGLNKLKDFNEVEIPKLHKFIFELSSLIQP